jgi:hypothetical protein
MFEMKSLNTDPADVVSIDAIVTGAYFNLVSSGQAKLESRAFVIHSRRASHPTAESVASDEGRATSSGEISPQILDVEVHYASRNVFPDEWLL